jgi:hypothetical protein
VKDPSIALVPKLPHGEQGQGSQRLTLRSCPVRQQGPPLLDIKIRPIPCMETLKPNPILEKFPNSNGEATMDEKMIR